MALGIWYGFLVPTLLIVVYCRTKWVYFSLVIAIYEICVALASAALLPFSYGVGAALVLSVTCAVFLLMAYWDDAHPKRTRLNDYRTWGFTPNGKFKPGEKNEYIVKPLRGSAGMDLPFLEVGNSALHFAKNPHNGAENIDEPELAFQLAAYTTFLLLCGLQLVFGSAQGQVGISVTLNAATVTLIVICTLLRILSNLKSVAVYIQGLVVQFCPLFIQVFASTFVSATVAMLTINDAGDAGAYIGLVCLLPIVLCAMAPVELAHDVIRGESSAADCVNTLQRIDLYLFPWWFFRATCESCWWSIQLVFLLANSFSAITFTPNDSFENARIVTSTLGVMCAALYIMETFVFVVPDVAVKEKC